MLGHERPELGNVTLCDKFQPTIHEGQLCYSLDIAKLTQKPTRPGKRNGLFLLVDKSPYQVKSAGVSLTDERNDQNTFKVYIHTLSQHTAYGPGTYAMSALKKMTGTTSFMQLPEEDKMCFVHDREDCQTQKYFDQVQTECKCIPWALKTDKAKNQVKEMF